MNLPDDTASLRNSVLKTTGFILASVIAGSSAAAVFSGMRFGLALMIWTTPVVLIYSLVMMLNLDYIRDGAGRIRESFGFSNALTSTRIISVAPMLVSFFYGRDIAGLVIYCLAALSDVADGVIARRYSQQTLMGVMIDPVGDILSTEAVCVFLWIEGMIPFWVLALLSIRYVEFFAGLLFLRIIDQKPDLRATIAGKIVGVVQFSGFSLLLLDYIMEHFQIGDAAQYSIFTLLGISFAVVIISQTYIGIKALTKQRFR